MKQETMDVLDAPDAILIPACTEKEVPLEVVKDASTFTRVEGSLCFPIDFRMRRLIIDAVAQKYQPQAGGAANDDDGDIVCIGETLCERAWNSGSQALADVADHLRAVRGSTDGIVAVHTLGYDDLQAAPSFLALGKQNAFLYTKATGDVPLSYAELRLTADGLTTTKRFYSEGTLLVYPLSDAFRAFLREFVLLRRTSLTNVHARHPLADMAFESRVKYLDFLVDAAAAEGRLTAASAVRLEYMAREFHVSADDLTKSFEKAAAGGIPETKMYDHLAQFLLKYLKSWEAFVFYQDILSIIVEADGGNCRPCLYRLLQRKALAGEAFVTSCAGSIRSHQEAEAFVASCAEAVRCYQKAEHDIVASCAEAIRCDQKAKRDMEAAVSSIGSEHRNLYWPNLQRMQRYNEEFRLKMMDIGVMTDE